MKILLTNDDGVTAPGIRAVAEHLHRDHELFVIAPDNERSGVSQSITYRRPFFTKRFQVGSGIEALGVNGYPVDCVKIGLYELCPFRPDLIISGMNNGLNVARNVAHSGTVAGALAGSAAGYASLALSLDHTDSDADFARAMQLVWPICQTLIADGAASGQTLNINIPIQALNGTPEWHVVPANPNPMGNQFVKGADPAGRPYFWQSNDPAPEPMHCQSDVDVVTRGDIAITPLTHDLTLHSELEGWQQRLASVYSSR